MPDIDLLSKSTHLTLGLTFILLGAVTWLFTYLSGIKEQLASHNARLRSFENLPRDILHVKTCLARIEGYLAMKKCKDENGQS